MEPLRAGILDRVFQQLRAHPEASTLFIDEAHIARLKTQMDGYLQELFESEVDWPYVLRRLWIGVAHHRVHLTPQWYLLCYSHFICDHLRPLFEAAPTPTMAKAQVIALLRRCFFDASLVLDAYGHTDDAAHWQHINKLDAPTQEGRHSGPPLDLKLSLQGESMSGAYASTRLTEVNAQDRKRFIGLSEADLANLRRLQPLIAAQTPAILEEFHAFLDSAPETSAMMPPGIVGRLKQQLASYWRELVEGEFDPPPSAASRIHIGIVHERIGLGPEWYLAGLARQLEGFIQTIDPAQADAPELIQALVRAVLFDVSFVIDAYMEARVTRLFRTEGYAQQLVEGLASAVAVIDGRDRLISANRTLISMTNGDPALLYLMSVEKAIPIPGLGKLLQHARESNTPRVVGAGNLGGRNYRIAVLRLTHQADATSIAALVMDDITDMLRIGADMDRQSDRYDQLGDIVGSVLWEMDLDTWTITSINQGSLDLTGTRSVLYLGRAQAWTDQMVEVDRERFKQRALALQPGEKTAIEYRMQRVDGQEVWVRSNLGRSRDRQDHRIFGASTDISASRRSEALRLEGMARIASGVAHIVNNSLMAVLGNIELHTMKSGGAEQMPLLAAAVKGTLKARAMASQLLAFSGLHPVKPLLMSLSDSCRWTLPKLQFQMGPNIQIQLDLAEDLWTCRLDYEMFAQSLESLAENAKEAMSSSGTLRITTRNLPNFQPEAGKLPNGQEWVELEVADSGHGMSPQTLARASEPFFSTRSLAEASGLGHSLVHGFVNQSGGQVFIESEPGKGTKVHLRFPRTHKLDGLGRS